MRRPLTALVAAAMLLLVLPLPAAGSANVDDDGAAAQTETGSTFTYEVHQRGAVEADIEEFAETVRLTLYDTRGWWGAGVDLRPVSSGGDFNVVLASPAEVEAAHPVCDAAWSCRVGDDVLVNDVRWRQGTQAWTGTLEGYRRYLLNHEVGHWLGLGHYSCPGAGEPAPVMQQQSIDLEGCEPNGWPLSWEVDQVASVQGTTPREPADLDARGTANACEPVDLGQWAFPDVDGYSDGVQDAIRCAAAYEITTGYEDDTYRPAREIRRHEMALFLARVLRYAEGADVVSLPDAPAHPFDDVDGVSEEAQAAVALLYELEVTLGTGETTYSPHDPVTRRDMASFLVRLQDVWAPGSYDTTAGDLFPDVPDTLARHEHINALAEQGIVQGFSGGTYRPGATVNRAQMALFVMRHVDENVAAQRLPALDPEPAEG